jgi:hypothetical protein
VIVVPTTAVKMMYEKLGFQVFTAETFLLSNRTCGTMFLDEYTLLTPGYICYLSHRCKKLYMFGDSSQISRKYNYVKGNLTVFIRKPDISLNVSYRLTKGVTTFLRKHLNYKVVTHKSNTNKGVVSITRKPVGKIVCFTNSTAKKVRGITIEKSQGNQYKTVTIAISKDDLAVACYSHEHWVTAISRTLGSVYVYAVDWTLGLPDLHRLMHIVLNNKSYVYVQRKGYISNNVIHLADLDPRLIIFQRDTLKIDKIRINSTKMFSALVGLIASPILTVAKLLLMQWLDDINCRHCYSIPNGKLVMIPGDYVAISCRDIMCPVHKLQACRVKAYHNLDRGEQVYTHKLPLLFKIEAHACNKLNPSLITNNMYSLTKMSRSKLHELHSKNTLKAKLIAIAIAGDKLAVDALIKLASDLVFYS